MTSVSYAQWLETTIYLPDSLSGISNPQSFAFNATNNKIYVGGSAGNWVIVINGATNQKIASVPTGSNISALCWNSINNKVYSANYSSMSVTVIDSFTNQVITNIAVEADPANRI
ncbi:MAG: hypothetical protein N2201_03640 [candidate division WOR-3 bacterium]|nr:hypothetical protein [candidate division WOR-3 bacterium]